MDKNKAGVKTSIKVRLLLVEKLTEKANEANRNQDWDTAAACRRQAARFRKEVRDAEFLERCNHVIRCGGPAPIHPQQ